MSDRQTRKQKRKNYYRMNKGLDAENECSFENDGEIEQSNAQTGEVDVFEFNEEDIDQDSDVVLDVSDSDSDTPISSDEEEDEEDQSAPVPSTSNGRKTVYEANGTDWKREDRTATKSRHHNKIDVNRFHPGPTGAVNIIRTKGMTDGSILNCFMTIMTPHILGNICTYTNKYAETYYRAYNRVYEKTSKWTSLIPQELYAFIGLLLRAGLQRGKDQPVFEMWSTNETRRNPAFVATMSRDRFQQILAFLRFDDVEARKTGLEDWLEKRIQNKKDRREKRMPEEVPILLTSENNDKLLPVREMWENFVQNIQTCFVPDTNITVDEMLLKFRGRCPFRTYLPSKPGKYGIKVWVAVCTFTGYVINMEVYLGKIGDQPEKGLGKKVVLSLTKDYLHIGRGITGDNFFSSKELVDELLKANTTYVGTMRACRKEVPKDFLQEKTLDVGQSDYLYSKDVTLLKHQTKKNKAVLLISSEHHFPENSPLAKDKNKPMIISHYNNTKAGVDKVDQMVSRYTCQRPTRRWPLKVFFCLLDVAALNAFQIWMHVYGDWERGNRSRRREFIWRLTTMMIKPWMQRRLDNQKSTHPHVKECMKLFGIGPKTKDRKFPLPPTEQKKVIFSYAKPCETIVNERKCSTNSRTGCVLCFDPICADHQRYKVLCVSCKENENAVEENHDF